MANGRRPFVPEQPPRIDATTSRVRNWAWSQFRKLRNYLRELEEALVGLGGISTIGEIVPGTGNVWDDINAHCFSGPHSDGACRICIGPANIAYFGHNNIVYRWLGPTEVCLGSGGAGGTYPHYLATSSDLVPTGSTDHSVLSNRDQPNQHPQSAVTDLVTDQASQNSRLSALEAHPPRTDNPHSVTHAQLPDKGTNDHAAVDAHIANTLIHFQDVPVDGIGYIRQDRVWVPSVNLAVLYGTPQDQTLGVAGFRLSDWDNSADAGGMSGTTDPVAGYIQLPVTGLYRISAHIHGDQGNDTKEESIWLQLEIVGGTNPRTVEISHESVDTDKTTSRTLSFDFVSVEDAGAQLYVRMSASAGLGTFSFQATQFSVAKLI